jgi:transcription initiation factor IIE alpha subunit
MSKFILRKRTSGYTTVSNSVIHALKGHLEVLGLYLYLLSLPDNWEFYKTQLCKECKVGINKLDKMLKILSELKLVQYGQKRGLNGQFEHFYMDIFDIESIKINELDNDGSPFYENRGTVTVAPSQEATKEIIKKIKKEKINIPCSSSDEPKHFDEFWENYPRKQKKKETKKIWKREKLDEIALIIISDVKKRSDEYWKFKHKEHIPLPDTYLNGTRWNDEHIKPATSEKSNSERFVLQKKEEVVRPKLRDYTQERLDREAKL